MELPHQINSNIYAGCKLPALTPFLGKIKFMKSIYSGYGLAVFISISSSAACAAQIDEATKKMIVENLSSKISESYVFPEKARLIAKRLREKESSGAYIHIDNYKKLALALTHDLVLTSNDLHLKVRFEVDSQASKRWGEEKTPVGEKLITDQIKSQNYGIEKVSILPGNIGYFDLRRFTILRFSMDEIGAAMSSFAHTKALIIDLRKNSGGDPNMVAFISSYLFDKPTHLNDMYWRKGNRTDEFWTGPSVPGEKFGEHKKVYILVSKETFSAAEEFTYNLKQLKRATIIGEKTAGGAHPGGWQAIHPRLSAFIPVGRAVNPISKSNWEGSGVTPDIEKPATEALMLAEQLAR